jgi:hypothetical protein
MSKPSDILELNYNSEEARRALHAAMTGLPPSVDVYLIGGAVRNALFREFHGVVLAQRDYDQVIIKDSKEYAEYLAGLGYLARPYPSRQDEQIVYSLALNEQAKDGDSYVNWLVFDMHTVDGTTIEQNMLRSAAFTINGCAIRGNDLFARPWREAVIPVLPTAVQDIKDKRLRLNGEGYKYMASNFYAMLRFMSVGFSAPPEAEIQLLLHELPKLEHARFARNVKKVWDYVGGEDTARRMVKDLGIDIDVFDEESVKSKL